MTGVAEASAPLGILRIARVTDRCSVLGPGVRSVVWVQGCALRCRECVTPEALSMSGGTEVTVADLANRLDGQSHSGLTLSGGEPFLQSRGLVELIDRLRVGRPDLSVMSYSGYTLTWLRRRGDAHQQALLRRLDLLVDGPYIPERHAALRWRGSSNQKLHVLSRRHLDLLGSPDISSGLEFELEEDGRMRWSGVPPVPRFQERLRGALAAAGLSMGDSTVAEDLTARVAGSRP
jgi:anaerobic ribonucleoside-triphosphate reductase activating protein